MTEYGQYLLALAREEEHEYSRDRRRGIIGSNLSGGSKETRRNISSSTWMRRHTRKSGELERYSQDAGYRFVRADIRDRAKMNEIFFEYDITACGQLRRGIARRTAAL
jgi:hypothetical protein